MKQIRMIVSAAVVLAVVGSSLAFTPSKFNTKFCARKVSLGTGVCGFITATQTGSVQYYTNPIANPSAAACAAVNCTTNIKNLVAE